MKGSFGHRCFEVCLQRKFPALELVYYLGTQLTPEYDVSLRAGEGLCTSPLKPYGGECITVQTKSKMISLTCSF